MKYVIINKNGRKLDGFHSNGGWSIGDVFPCSNSSYIVFEKEKEVQEYLIYMQKKCIEQSDRWGDWLDVALKFVKKLEYKLID